MNTGHVYVGTSAGSFIAALCANGVSPEEMMRVVTRQGKPPFKDIDLNDLLRPNLVEFARKGALLPLRAASLARDTPVRPQCPAMSTSAALARTRARTRPRARPKRTLTRPTGVIG